MRGVVLAIGLCGCAAAGNAPGGASDGGGGAGGGEGGFDAGGGSDTGGATFTEVFGHSASDLYRLDPTTNAVTEIGRFEGCNYVVDIAIDRHGRMLASTIGSLWQIDPATAACTLIAEGNFPNALSFVPVGTVDPDEEALVGYIALHYTRIDVDDGEHHPISPIADGYTTSGDIVAVDGGKAFLTVKGNGCDDCLMEIDPRDGDLLHNYGDLGYSDVYGLAFWGGAAYGFTRGGELFRIAFDGGSLATTPIPIPDAPANLSFAGAGSSTRVPLAP